MIVQNGCTNKQWNASMKVWSVYKVYRLNKMKWVARNYLVAYKIFSVLVMRWISIINDVLISFSNIQ